MYCSCIFNRIAIDQLSRDSPPRMSAAALSAAEDSINKQKTAPTLRRNQLRRNTSLKRHPLFGREGSGGRGASRREAASPPEFPTSSYAARPRRLCQPPWTQSISRKPQPLSGGTGSEEAPNSNAIRSLGERGLGGERGFSQRSSLSPQSSPRPSLLCRNFFACVE